MKKIYLVSYDITSNKKRKKVADKLLYYGLIRVQYSVFMGSMSSTLYQQLLQWIKPLFQKEDQLVMLRLTEASIRQMIQFGEADLDVDYLTGSKNTLYFSYLLRRAVREQFTFR